MNDSRPKVYLKSGCPFSTKLFVFLTETDLNKNFQIITVKNQSDAHHNLFARVKAADQKPTFPIIEHASGEFESDSESIINRLAQENQIDTASLPLLRFYNEGMLVRAGKMFMELKRLKGADWDGEL